MDRTFSALVDTFLEAFGCEPAYVTMAPGRLEFLGNHTDYNGGCVLGAALNLGVYAGIMEREDDKILIASAYGDQGLQSVESNLHEIELFEVGDARSWANYPLGVLKIILSRGVSVKRGFNIAFWSDLPSGVGLSSSAALELAALRAISILYDMDIDDPLDIARIGRQAENEEVGVSCGILDQGVSAYGKADNLVFIDCQSEAYTLYALPEGTSFWIFNTNDKHEHADSLYAARYEECMQACDALKDTYVGIHSICEVASGQVEPCELDMPQTNFKRALHVTREHERVKQAAALLSSKKPEPIGELLFASHESSRDLFENSTPELDFIVEQLREQSGVYGARLSGGGFGGVVIAWAHDAFTQEHADKVVAGFEQTFGKSPTVYHVQVGDGARIL